ncbi:MAG: prepilin-type N-terminal cleavage/methylation domain-containing protein [Bdellovibrionaceae bacterium]|nr:prepilin-type N-terminal cleavage/methylation domain-containing protein [Pseudobdellovibrionaceae bacterium]
MKWRSKVRIQVTRGARLSGERGHTLVEVIVALVVLLIVIAASTQGLTQLRGVFGSLVTSRVRSQEVNNVIENLRNNITLYQINFDSSPDAREALLDPERLPLAWNNVGVFNVEECASCPGRLGYVIQPYPMLRGVYLVHVRLTHKSMGDTYQDHRFIVSTK